MPLINHDAQIAALIEKEHKRQLEGAELIASENFTSEAVMQARFYPYKQVCRRTS